MTEEDLNILCCPQCTRSLKLFEGYLRCPLCLVRYPIINGIPRFILETDYNKTWDYKWTVLDGGRGYNYELLNRNASIDKRGLFFSFEDDIPAKVKTALDIGCGIGQYSIALLQKGISKVYAIDLTAGVDVGRKIILERYPEYAERIQFIQADARFLPIKTGSVDIAMALGSLHHTGNLEGCIREVVRITRRDCIFFVWIYGEPDSSLALRKRVHRIYAEGWFWVLKKFPRYALMPILKAMASDTVWHLRRWNRWIAYALPGCGDHPDKGYRLINLYDAYSPQWSENSSEDDVFRWAQLWNFNIERFTTWRLGFVGRIKRP